MAKRANGNNAVVEVEALTPVEQEEVQLATESGNFLSGFFAGVVAFLSTGRQLEKRARGTLMAAKAIPAPQDGAADAVVQSFVRRCAGEKKGVLEHWDPATSLLHSLHKRLVSIRNRAVDPLDEAVAIGNRLHNAYTAEAKRKAAAEQEAKRLEEERRAAAERQKELDKLEAEARKAEESSEALSLREKAVVDELWRCGFSGGSVNARAIESAAKLAGYRDCNLTTTRKSKIIDALDARRSADAIREQANARAQAPLDVREVEDVKPDIVKAAGAHDRTTWSGEVLDLDALRTAAFDSPELGIPRDLFVVDPKRLNELARSLKLNLNRWPGVRAKSSTGIV